MTDSEHIVYLGLGTNLGDRQENMRTACAKIEKLIGPIVRQSAFFETQPWGFQSEHAFLNAAVCCQTACSPREVLRLTQQIEREMGRTQKSVNRIYHDRLIDIDILLYDHLTVSEPDLKIPHPLMRERDFVMEPLLQILPPDYPL
jgi:2-amino-4-hydroxy-6-hydroxymethyldihydropteridine diphosphokinase